MSSSHTMRKKKLENMTDEGNKNNDNGKRRWILNWARKRILYNCEFPSFDNYTMIIYSATIKERNL